MGPRPRRVGAGRGTYEARVLDRWHNGDDGRGGRGLGSMTLVVRHWKSVMIDCASLTAQIAAAAATLLALQMLSLLYRVCVLAVERQRAILRATVPAPVLGVAAVLGAWTPLAMAVLSRRSRRSLRAWPLASQSLSRRSQ